MNSSVDREWRKSRSILNTERRQRLLRGLGGGFSRPIIVFLAASFIFVLVSPQQAAAQTAGRLPELESAKTVATGYYSSPIPLSYSADGEEKKDAKEGTVRRGLTIAAGSFPFSYFYTNLAFDLVRYAISGFDSSYAPWPFRSVGSVSIDTRETFIRLGVGVGLSLAIGLADILSR